MPDTAREKGRRILLIASNMTEAALTTDFKHAIEKLRPTETIVYEFKMVKGNRFNLKTVAEHQVQGLEMALKGLWYKLADMQAVNGFGARKPFDSIWIVASHAYVCPIYYKSRQLKRTYLIPVKRFKTMLEEFKSVTMAELDALGICSIDL